MYIIETVFMKLWQYIKWSISCDVIGHGIQLLKTAPCIQIKVYVWCVCVCARARVCVCCVCVHVRCVCLCLCVCVREFEDDNFMRLRVLYIVLVAAVPLGRIGCLLS